MDDKLNGPGGVPDLGALKHAKDIEEREADASVFWEKRAGLRCQGCGRRLDQKLGGWEFVRPSIEQDPDSMTTRGIIRTQRSFACADRACGFAATLAEGAVAMRPVTPWFFMDSIEELIGPKEPGPDPDPSPERVPAGVA